MQLSKLQQRGLTVVSKTGDKNQDNYFIFADSATTIMGVFDGHGECGHHCSRLAQELALKFLLASPLYRDNPGTALKEMFEKVDEALRVLAVRRRKFSVLLSGTTGTVVLKREKDILVANVGDSRAIKATVSKEGVKVLRLSKDHSPGVTRERERIEQAGGNVLDDIHARVYFAGEDFPSLALSRALGDDVYKSAGVISQPEVCLDAVEDARQFVVVGSDGVWEFLRDEEVGEVVCRSSKGALDVVSAAHEKWMKFNGQVADDITCVVYSF